MVDYEIAIKRPFKDLKKFVIGSFLTLIPIVNLIVTGFFAVAAKNTMNKKNDLPNWENLVELFIKGLSVAIIGFVYSLLGIALLFVGIGSVVIGAIMNGSAATSMYAAMAGGGLLVLTGLFFLLLAGLIVPIAVMRYVDKGNLGAAFAIGDVVRKIFTAQYLMAWLIIMVYSLAVCVLCSFIPVVSYAIAGFIVGMTSFTVFAEVYSGMK
ncbi:MAG: DUF4013 domain-containing protein [archaeon]|nr:DUF4013 domain-containing protein [archaeon]